MLKRMVRQTHHKILMVLLVLLFAAWPVHAGTTVRFSPQGGISKSLVKMYKGAKSDIKVVMYAITAKNQVSALIAAHRRGVKVQVILDNKLGHQKTSMDQVLTGAGIPVRYVGPSGGSMHHKFIIVDGKCLATGSYNLSDDAEYRSNEAMMFMTEKKVIAAFIGEFEKLWNQEMQEE